MKIKRDYIYKFHKLCVLGTGIVLFTVLISNWVIISSTRALITSDIKQIQKADVGIILGAAVYSDKRVSPIVEDRIKSAVELYKKGKVRKLLISGDHGEKYYDEVNTIKYWVLKYDVPLTDIYLDNSGFSTFESMGRARQVFRFQNAVIITQSFHLPRALYLARHYGISAQGFAADQRIYKNIHWFMTREYLARLKDFFYIHMAKADLS